VLSALVLGPAVLLAVWLGGWVFLAVILAFALIASYEWTRLVEPERTAGSGIAAAAAVLAVLVALLAWGGQGALVAVLVLTPLVYGATRLLKTRHPKLIAAAVPYVGGGAAGLALLRTVPEAGLGLILFVMLAVWATDTGAYAAGRTIGGPKLMPRVSPKKTWAGLIGGMAAAALAGWAVAAGFGAARPGLGAGICAALAVIAQAGDLFESWVKRRYGVKDSGHLIPGHGGILDRVDGLLAAAPAFALFQALWGTSASWW
jgi:phosphatidate cytidylyltransferase